MYAKSFQLNTGFLLFLQLVVYQKELWELLHKSNKYIAYE